MTASAVTRNRAEGGGRRPPHPPPLSPPVRPTGEPGPPSSPRRRSRGRGRHPRPARPRPPHRTGLRTRPAGATPLCLSPRRRPAHGSADDSSPGAGAPRGEARAGSGRGRPCTGVCSSVRRRPTDADRRRAPAPATSLCSAPTASTKPVPVRTAPPGTGRTAPSPPPPYVEHGRRRHTVADQTGMRHAPRRTVIDARLSHRSGRGRPVRPLSAATRSRAAGHRPRPGLNRPTVYGIWGRRSARERRPRTVHAPFPLASSDRAAVGQGSRGPALLTRSPFPGVCCADEPGEPVHLVVLRSHGFQQSGVDHALHQVDCFRDAR